MYYSRKVKIDKIYELEKFGFKKDYDENLDGDLCHIGYYSSSFQIDLDGNIYCWDKRKLPAFVEFFEKNDLLEPEENEE